MSLQIQLDQLIQNIQLLEPFYKTYQPFINTAAIFLASMLLLKWIRAKRKKLQKTQTYDSKSSAASKSAYTLSSKDIKMVAGEDVITTQLDLARAYIELGKKNLAKSILYHVTKSGRPEQQQEAQKLMSTL